MKKFRKSNGWHINWNEIPKNVEVYALALEDDNTIQGLVGIKNDKDSHAVYLHWACTAPHNNKHEYGSQKYVGVGGHLFAIAEINLLNGDMRGQYMDLLPMKNRQKSYWRCIIMNGTKPKFMENSVIVPSYYEQPEPYVNAPSCQVNLLE
ncbi:MAG: hypothetical protein K2N85_02245, partial [Lachnospiraceae bacterium]|nr:hypothetical protein [Lachnospiraceae bacterium]